MGRWGVGLGLWLTLVGCQPSNEDTGSGPSEAPTQPEPGSDPSVPASGTVPTHGGTVPTEGGTLPTDSALEGAPSLAPAACVPWPGTTPPRRGMACEVRSTYGSPLRPYAFEVSRYDSDGHLLEKRAMLSEILTYSVETHTWVDGLEVHRLVDNVQWHGSEEREWTYDSQRRIQQLRVIKKAAQASPVTTVYRYTYAPDGLLERIDSSFAEQSTGWTVYHHDAAGSVESILSEPGCDRDMAPCETFTYYPNGRPHTVGRYAGIFWSTTDTYDERGQLVATRLVDFDTMLDSTRSYDAAGRVTRIWEKGGVNYSSHETVTTFVHDSEGRRVLERTAEDAVTQGGPAQAVPDRYTSKRVTHRLTYICGTKLVWLDEWDSNEDGVPDAWRTHERDSTGRLLHEQYSGTPGMDDGPIRQDFVYDCH